MVIGAHLHGSRGPCGGVHAGAGYFFKNPYQAKMAKNGQKWLETGFLDFLGKPNH